jgi:hypothetical protein
METGWRDDVEHGAILSGEIVSGRGAAQQSLGPGKGLFGGRAELQVLATERNQNAAQARRWDKAEPERGHLFGPFLLRSTNLLPGHMNRTTASCKGSCSGQPVRPASRGRLWRPGCLVAAIL